MSWVTRSLSFTEIEKLIENWLISSKSFSFHSINCPREVSIESSTAHSLIWTPPIEQRKWKKGKMSFVSWRAKMSFCFLKSYHIKTIEVDEVSDLSFLIKVPKPPYIPIQNNHEYFVDPHQHPTPHQCDEQLYRFARSWPPSMTMPDLPCHMRALVLCVGLFSGLSPVMELGIKQPRSCPLPTDVLHIISQKPTTIYDYIRLWCVCRSWRSLQHTRSIGNLELTKWVLGKFWAEF